MSESKLTKLKLLDGYRFIAIFDENGIPSLVVDEQKPIGENAGPDPTSLLSVAVGQCLSSSLLYCMQKARVKVMNLETIVRAAKERNGEGFLRIRTLDVQLHLVVNEEDKERVARCLEIFENYCTITQSVIRGIKVNVNIVETST